LIRKNTINSEDESETKYLLFHGIRLSERILREELLKKYGKSLKIKRRFPRELAKPHRGYSVERATRNSIIAVEVVENTGGEIIRAVERGIKSS